MNCQTETLARVGVQVASRGWPLQKMVQYHRDVDEDDDCGDGLYGDRAADVADVYGHAILTVAC